MVVHKVTIITKDDRKHTTNAQI